MGLCTLADLKTWLGISDTSQDVKLQLFIDNVSTQIETYLGYPLARTTYTGDVYTINNYQLLYLRQQPIQSVTSVTLDGISLTAGQEDGYYLSTEDAKGGRLYRPLGWCGKMYSREMTYDAFAGARTILVSWVGGYYLPGDTGYVKGQDASLPYAISSACINECLSVYRKNRMQAEGLTSFSEGGMSWGWQKKDSSYGVYGSGLSEATMGMLNPFKRWACA